ncbi:MAG: NlpC/P60 family protein [Ferruginibacter sp.]|nr:NlpC/P60 family protein [Ferruginibacter sp.]
MSRKDKRNKNYPYLQTSAIAGDTMRNLFILCLFFIFSGCTDNVAVEEEIPTHDSIVGDGVRIDTVKPVLPVTATVDTKNVSAAAVVDYAKTLLGIPYQYGSADPVIGFDCSGFITYVFNHFGISVPRSSVDFTNVGEEVARENASPGDLILFTGTDSLIRVVGHMGIVVQNTDTLKFIHSTSGKIYGVTITPLSDYYKGRFVKTIRVFK